MHETSIALAILSAVEEKFRSLPGARRVTAINLRIGLLSLVDVESLRFALQVASRGTPAEGAEVNITLEPPLFKCRECGHTWEVPIEELKKVAEELGLLSAMHIYPDVILGYLKCPRCGSTNIEIIRGKGVVLESIEVDTEE